MTVNSTRSQRLGLIEGATDGKYRKARPNTEVVPGMGNEVMERDRNHLHPPMNYGFVTQEIPVDQRAIPGG